MKPVFSELFLKPRLVKTRLRRHQRQSALWCAFCHQPFRRKENRMIYKFPWQTKLRSIDLHMVCYLPYLHITALAIFQEINNNGRTNSKR